MGEVTMGDATLQDWVGRTETLADVVTPTPVRALSATLNGPQIDPQAGDPVPPLWSWLYFLPIVPTAQVGPDGHPQRGGFLPPIELERRMWAGSRVTFHDEIRIGDNITKSSEILKIAAKQGRAGQMVFITVGHRVASPRGLAVEEEQDIVYIAMPKIFAPPPPVPAPADAAWSDPIAIDPVLLFRFSALTFNCHRIHYDRPYAVDVEKYPGLVVHGPLQAVLLMESARRHVSGRQPTRFEFRGVRPLFEFDQVRILGKPRADGGHDVCTVNGEDRIGMQSTIQWRP